MRTHKPRKSDFSNKAEQAFYDLAASRGYEVTKRGWPDFFCFDDTGRLMVVEVKKPTQFLRRDQAIILRALAQYGIPAYVYTEAEGLKQIDPISGRDTRQPKGYRMAARAKRKAFRDNYTAIKDAEFSDSWGDIENES